MILFNNIFMTGFIVGISLSMFLILLFLFLNSLYKLIIFIRNWLDSDYKWIEILN
jgi:hypothetical protein